MAEGLIAKTSHRDSGSEYSLQSILAQENRVYDRYATLF